jgi:hypothetical protein
MPNNIKAQNSNDQNIGFFDFRIRVLNLFRI